MVAVYIILWIVSGLIGGGFVFAYTQSTYKDDFDIDLGVSLLLGIVGGPVLMVVGFFWTGFGKHGWWFWGGAKNES